MPKKKAGYDSALGSIFDFIFKESKKKPAKFRPPRLTGKDNSSSLAGAFTEIASKPYIYFNGAVAGTLNGALGQSIIDISVDKPNPGKTPGVDPDRGRFRVRTSDLGKFLTNPNKYWQDVFNNAKAESQFAKYVGAGKIVDGALTTLWAAHNKLPVQTALDLGMATSTEVSNPMAQKAEKMLVQNIAYDSFNRQDAKKIIEVLDKTPQTNYTRDSLKKLLSKEFSGAALDNYSNKLYDLYIGNRVTGTADPTQGSKNFAMNKGGNLTGVGGGAPGRYLTEGRLNAFGFREITAENLKKKANLIDLTSAKTAQERTQLLQQKRTLLESAALMETISRAKFSYQPQFPNFSKTVAEIDKTINNLGARGTRLSPQDQAFRNSLFTLKQTIEQAGAEYEKKTGANRKPGFFTITRGIDKYDASSVKKAINAEIEFEKVKVDRLILELQGKSALTSADKSTLESLLEKRQFIEAKERSLRTLPLTDFRYNVNSWMSAYSAIKSTLIDGKNVGSIIDGSFYRDEGFFRSSSMGMINYMKTDRQGKPLLDKRGKPIVAASYGAMYYGGTGKAWQQMTWLYYMTPSVIVSSLVNGDIPAFLTYNARHQFIEALNDPKKLQALLSSPLGSQLKDFLESDGTFKMGLDNDPVNFKKLVDVLKNSNDPLIKKLAMRTDSFVKVSSDLALVFSPVAQFNAALRQWDAAVGGRIRKFVSDKLLKKMLDNAAWQSAVEQFVTKNIGVLQMVRVYVQEVVAMALEAVGISLGGPVGAVIAFVASEIATSMVFEVAKGLMQLLSVVVILIIALFGFIFFFSTNVLFHNPIASATSYRYVVPGSELQCTNYNPDSVNYPTSPDPGGNKFPPVNSSCPFTFTPQVCTQGHGSDASSYHQRVQAMDVGTNNIPEGQDVWYAPTDGKITKFEPSNSCADGSDYGGWLEFTDSAGTVYVLLHVRAVASIGGRIEKGHAVAVSMHDLTPGYCWTGAHFHVEVKVGGAYQDAEDWYRNKLKCTGLTACP